MPFSQHMQAAYDEAREFVAMIEGRPVGEWNAAELKEYAESLAFIKACESGAYGDLPTETKRNEGI